MMIFDDCDKGGDDVVGDGHGVYDHPLINNIVLIMMMMVMHYDDHLRMMLVK